MGLPCCVDDVCLLKQRLCWRRGLHHQSLSYMLTGAQQDQVDLPCCVDDVCLLKGAVVEKRLAPSESQHRSHLYAMGCRQSVLQCRP